MNNVKITGTLIDNPIYSKSKTDSNFLSLMLSYPQIEKNGFSKFYYIKCVCFDEKIITKAQEELKIGAEVVISGRLKFIKEKIDTNFKISFLISILEPIEIIRYKELNKNGKRAFDDDLPLQILDKLEK